MWWLVALGIAGCGRLSFDAVGKPNSDAVGNPDGDPATGDVALDAPPCTFGAWSAPVNLALNTSFDDWSPTISDDGLELIFQSSRGGDEDLYQAVRASTSDSFPTAVTALAAVNSGQNEKAPTISADRKTLYFTSDRTGVERLYRATRATPQDAFGMPGLVPGLDTTDAQGPSVSLAGDELYFENVDGDVARAVLSGSAFAVAGVLTELGAARYPDLTRDRLTIFFARSGAADVWSATRSDPGAVFGTPSVVSELDDANANDTDPDFGDGDRALVFTSTRSGGAGASDIWIVTRPCN